MVIHGGDKGRKETAMDYDGLKGRRMQAEIIGPRTEAGNLIHAEKYRGKDEPFREAMNRIAAATQDDHDHYMHYRQILLKMRFMPAGRVQAAMGSLKNITAYNCFVMGTINDSFTDDPNEEEIALHGGSFHPVSIMETAMQAAKTMRQGGGVGYDISTLRPSGDQIRGVQSITNGPLAFAPIYDAVCRATSSAGNRRGAQMLVMRADHPDIEAFIRAKHVDDDNIPYHLRPLRGFNMSIAVTDELLDAVKGEKTFKLRFGGKDYREVDAVALWEMIMRSTYDWAEPGVLFIDQINRMNNLWYCEKIAATNPCGEQPLPPYGACLLGSFNVVNYLVYDAVYKTYHLDYEQLEADIPHVVRAMDNVVDRTRYPLPQQKIEAKNKRRMGLGVTGLANALEAMGYPYGSHGFLEMEDHLLHFITRHAYIASAMLAKEKGSFPLYDQEKYLQSKFIQTLDTDVVDLIKKYGIRNSHLTSIAPTGTISFSADNVSSALEPVVAYEQMRGVIMPEGKVNIPVTDYGVAFLGVRGRTIEDVTPSEHIAVLCAAQRNVDSAVSKTCNVPTNISWTDFKDIYFSAAEGGAKGCTTYRPAGKYDEPIKAIAEKVEFAEGEACAFDPVTGARTGNCAD